MSIDKLSSLANTLFVERRLPWGVSQQLTEFNTKALRRLYDFKVLSTRPYATGEDSPHFEIHMLLGHRHVGMCLWSVKSLLHVAGRKYKVVLHDDGSLTARDLDTLKKHLINVRIFGKAIADENLRERLTDFPNSLEFRFSSKETANHRGQYNMFIMSLILFDYNLLTEASKILLLDADVLFFKKPKEIMDWVDDPEDTRTLYSVEAFSPYRNERNELCFGPKTPRTLNSGLICLHKSVFDLEAIEGWIGANKELMYESSNFEQLLYEHFIKAQAGNQPLPDSYPFNYTDPDVVATHFGIKIRFFENLKRIEKALS